MNTTKNYITATKHANGRDWWLIVPRFASNKYWTFLFDPQGTHLVNTQSIGHNMNGVDWSGQTTFSPDGNKYIRYDPYNKLNIYDFDRCTGLLSNPLHIMHPFASIDTLVPGGVSISPNSRYLYLSVAAWVYQYDLWASDIAASRILVGEYDGTQAPLPTSFFRAQLAPDGKIYINCTNSNYTLHVIHQPDQQGINCQFENNAYSFNSSIDWSSMPYFPNYRLGALTGSSCDTLSLGTAPVAGFLWLLPDSAVSPLKVKFTSITSDNPDNWHWDFGDGSFSQDSCPVHIFPSLGTWHVCLIVSNDFGSDTTCQDVSLTTVQVDDKNKSESIFELSPNPANGAILFKWKEVAAQRILIYNQFQQIVFERDIHNSNILNVNTEDFSPGLYRVVLTDKNNKQFIRSLVIFK